MITSRSLFKIFTAISFLASGSSSAEEIRRVWYQNIMSDGALSKAAVTTQPPAVDTWNIESNSKEMFRVTTSCPNRPNSEIDSGWTEFFLQLGTRDYTQFHGYSFNFSTTKALLTKEELGSLITDSVRIQVRVVGDRNGCPQNPDANGEIDIWAICTSNIGDKWYSEQWGKNFSKSTLRIASEKSLWFDRTVYIDLQPQLCDAPLVLLVNPDQDQSHLNLSNIEVSIYNRTFPRIVVSV